LLTTGSYCIQHLALYYNVPMLFVPVLTEQYFWAKNYKQHTGIPYINNMNYTKENILFVFNTIESILSSSKLKKWLDKHYRHIRKTNGAKQVAQIVSAIVKKKQT